MVLFISLPDFLSLQGPYKVSQVKAVWPVSCPCANMKLSSTLSTCSSSERTTDVAGSLTAQQVPQSQPIDFMAE